MSKGIKFRFYLSLVVSALSLWLLSPTLWNLTHPDKLDAFPSWMPKTAMKLGLDLQGGVHMVLGVDLDKVVLHDLKNQGHNVETFAASKGLPGVKSTLDEKSYELNVTAGKPEDTKRLADLITQNFGQLEFVGENENVLVLRTNRDFESNTRTQAIDQSIETIRNRIDEFGVAEPVLARKGDSQILVQFPGAKETERLKGLIGQTAQLTFQIVHECQDGQCLAKQQADLDTKIRNAEIKGIYTRETYKRFSEYQAKINADLKDQIPPETVIAFQKEKDVNVNNQTKFLPFLLSTKHVITGDALQEAFVSSEKADAYSAERPVVSFAMNAVGAPLLESMTREFTHYFMAIVLDGTIKSYPRINTALSGGRGIIQLGTGSLEDVNREARDLAIVLKAGALPATIEVQEERVIGASMGADAINSGKSALAATLVMVLFFMWAYYGLAGLVSNFATIVNIAAIFAILGSLEATLTLPGIAGIVLTIGMAVDAIIIIFERMREELRLGRNSRQVIDLGFENAFSTILDSNVTTAIGALVLLEFGTGSIRGFALTLLVGIVVNVFMATFFLKAIMNMLFRDAKVIGLGLPKKDIEAAQAGAR